MVSLYDGFILYELTKTSHSKKAMPRSRCTSNIQKANGQIDLSGSAALVTRVLGFHASRHASRMFVFQLEPLLSHSSLLVLTLFCLLFCLLLFSLAYISCICLVQREQLLQNHRDLWHWKLFMVRSMSFIIYCATGRLPTSVKVACKAATAGLGQNQIKYRISPIILQVVPKS